jgi:hypothetical protein
MPPILSTAETLLLEALLAQRLVGIMTSTFKNNLWIKPQLDSLQSMGLVEWSFNTEADFSVVLTQAVRSEQNSQEILSRLVASNGALTDVAIGL